MARIELNIVALGDFKSVDSQIKNLRAQVELLNKSLTGTGLSTNLTRQLNDANSAFKASMLSTGQFTETTVKLKTETEKFGQALVSGKLKLSEYFSVIRGQSSAAAASMRALAIEQTKLQNSIITADPTKKGVFSVYTPTNLDAVANKTKIATNYQNLFNIAVDKGSQSLINWGKNTQWAGRQLTVGLTVPMAMFGSAAMKTFQQVNDELVKLQKVYGTGVTQPTKQALEQIKSQVVALSRELASSMGVAASDTAAMAAGLAATGKTGNDLIAATREAMRLARLGELDQQAAMQATVSLQNVYKLSTQDLTKSIDFLNAVENQTSTSLQDLVDGIPRVGPIVQQLGGSFKDTAVMMVAMKEAGVPAAQSANAIKSALASLINPSKAASEAFAAYNINLESIATKTGGKPVEMFMMLQQAMQGLEPLAKAQLIEKLFGKYQQARIQALITNLGAVNSQTKTAFDLVNASAPQLASLAASEMRVATESTTGRFRRAVETIKADIIPLGEKIMEVATVLLKFGDGIAKAFGSLPSPVKTVLGILAGAAALVGPIIMLVGLMGNFAGYILKTVFNLKNLITGTKTFGELFTPEMIASQNAADLFGNKILEDVGAIDLLNQSVAQLVANLNSMNMAMGGGTGAGIVPAIAGGTTKTKKYSAPGAINRQTQSAGMNWATEEAETAAAIAAAQSGPGYKPSHAKEMSNRVASHTELTYFPGTNMKQWVASKLMVDKQYVNQYVDTLRKQNAKNSIIEKFRSQAGTVAGELGMTEAEVQAELNTLRAGQPPTSQRSAQILQRVAGTDPNSPYARATAAGLKERLKGNFYSTIGSRKYDAGLDKSINEKALAKLTQEGVMSKSEMDKVAGKISSTTTSVVEQGLTQASGEIERKGLFKRLIGNKFAMSMGLVMGGQMIASALPSGGVASSLTGAATTGAGIGMMFGPEGALVGALAGAALGGVSALMKAEKEHAATVKSTFQTSASDVEFFGDKVLNTSLKIKGLQKDVIGITDKFGGLTPEVQKFVDYVNSLDAKDSTRLFVDSIRDMNLSSVTGSMRSKVTAAVSTGGLDPEHAKQYVMGLLAAAGRAKDFARVWAEVSKSVTNVAKATTVSLNKLSQEALKNYGSFVYGATGIAKGYDDLNTAQKAAADELYNLTGLITSGSLSYKDLQMRLDAINKSALGGANGIAALSAAIYKSGDKDAIAAFNNIRAALAGIGNEALNTTANVMKLMLLQNMGQGNKEVLNWAMGKGGTAAGIKPEDLTSKAGMTPDQIKGQWAGIALKYANSPEFKKVLADFNKAITAGATGSTPGAAGAGAGTATQKELLKQLKAKLGIEESEKKILDDKLKLEEKRTAEIKRQQDYLSQRTDLENQIRQAMATGDYLKANQLRQQMAFNTDQYVNEGKLSGAQANSQTYTERVNMIRNAIAELNDAMANKKGTPGSVSSVLKASMPKLSAGSVSIPTIGSGTNYSYSIADTVAGNSSNSYDVSINIANVSSEVDIKRAIDEAFSSLIQKQKASATNSKVGNR